MVLNLIRQSSEMSLESLIRYQIHIDLWECCCIMTIILFSYLQPMFNQEEFMAEMRSLIQISDESSRVDPMNSPLLSQPLSLMSPAITNLSRSTKSDQSKDIEEGIEGGIEEGIEEGIAEGIEDSQDDIQIQDRAEPIKKTPAVKKNVTYQPDTPANSSTEYIQEPEAIPYQETWNIPVVQMPKLPEQLPPRLSYPEMPPIDNEVGTLTFYDIHN